MSVIFQKYPADVRQFEISFVQFPEFIEGDTISTAAVVAAPSDLVIGIPTLGGQGQSVQVVISGGTAGQSYSLYVTIVTVGGSTIEAVGDLFVNAP